MRDVQVLTGLVVDEFLDRVAARTPTPGGGSVTCLAGALGCALGRMVVAYSLMAKTESPVRARLESAARRLQLADELFRGLVTRDAQVFELLQAAAKSSKSGQADSKVGNQKRMADEIKKPASTPSVFANAVLDALAVPLEAAAAAAEALEMLDEERGLLNKHMLSDLGAAAALLDGVAAASAYFVKVNAAQLPDAETRGRVLADIEAIVLRAGRHRRAIEAFCGSVGPVGRHT
jgi:formiminotetrahydrofolate cyclodeaminase